MTNQPPEEHTLDQTGAPTGEEAPPGLADWPAGTVILEDYQVDRLLGQGGMGSVYRVRSGSTGAEFAVKRIRPDLAGRGESRRAFLRELLAWSELPEHPNLTGFRFFRSLAGELLIFAELVTGGSLRDWIADGRTSDPAVLLDIAIQSARGLQVAHELSLVHQDVKPGNVLMTPEGLAKITDFGLARARRAAGPGSERASTRLDPGCTEEEALVSTGGSTPAYRSPEQAAGEPLGPGTDQWSWGLTVLAMATGGIQWMGGEAAPEVLAEVRSTLPDPVGSVLERCFQQDPSARWPDLSSAATALEEAYRELMGREYPREEPIYHSPEPVEPGEELGTDLGSSRGWLERALRETGRDPAEAASLELVSLRSRRSWELAEMANLSEARHLLAEPVARGRSELTGPLGRLTFRLAQVHQQLRDYPGSLFLMEEVERLLGEAGERRTLARLHTTRGAIRLTRGDPSAALESLERGDRIWEELTAAGEGEAIPLDRSNNLKLQALSIRARSGPEAALPFFDRALALLQEGDDPTTSSRLADVYLDKGAACSLLGRNQEALELFARSEALRERVLRVDPGAGERGNMATTLMNKANAHSRMGEFQEALEPYRRCIQIREKLAHREGRWEYAHDLAHARMNLSIALLHMKQAEESLEQLRAARGIWERLVVQEGRRELSPHLAMVYMNSATNLSEPGRHDQAIPLYHRAEELFQQLVEQEGRPEEEIYLALVRVNRSVSLLELDRNEESLEVVGSALGILDRQVLREGRREQAPYLAWARGVQGTLLDRLERWEEARVAFQTAVDQIYRMVTEEGRRELVGDLALDRSKLAIVLLRLGEEDKAAELARSCVEELEEAIRPGDRPDIEPVLEQVREQLEEILGPGDERPA